MRLLVSVASPDEAVEALSGGADIIDAKNPFAGSLGAVTLDVLREICTTVGDACPVTAALGDASDEASLAMAAGAFAAVGAQLVKIGFAGIANPERATSLARAAVRATEQIGPSTALRTSPSTLRQAQGCGLVIVAYADADERTTVPASDLLDVAARAGAKGVLLDTFDKSRRGLRALIAPDALAAWIAAAHARGLFVAVAGKLSAADLPAMRAAGADIVGVRGAACPEGRTGRISMECVRALRAQCVPDYEASVLG